MDDGPVAGLEVVEEREVESLSPANCTADASRSTSGASLPGKPGTGLLVPARPPSSGQLAVGGCSAISSPASADHASSPSLELETYHVLRAYPWAKARTVSMVSASSDRLVVAVADDAGEAQGQPTGVAGRALEAVEGDLDDLLGPQRYDVVVLMVSGSTASSVNRSVCQASISSVIPLNVLPSITKPSPSSDAGAEVDVGQPPLAPAAAPLDRQDDEVEGVHRLDLDPAGAATTRVVPDREALHDDALVAAGERVLGELLGRRGVVGDQAAARGAPRARACRGRLEPLGAGASSRSAPSRWSTSKKYGVTATPRRSMARARRRLLERPGRPSSAERDRLAVEDELARPGSDRTTSTTSGSRAVMSSRLRVAITTSSPRRWTWIRMPSSLVSTATGVPGSPPAFAIGGGDVR